MQVAAVVPCYRVKRHILDVIGRIGPECGKVYVVDDACPERTGHFVQSQCTDPRVVVIWNEVNQGVGGAVLAGYRRAIDDGADVIVKIDGDGQMPPELLPYFVAPIRDGRADYTKGNRFYDLESLAQMPRARIFGNGVLSFMAKLSTGYWDLFDPTNGYTAIHASVARHLPFDKISRRYFFETDLLFRLGTMKAAVVDIPMDAHYGDEVSGLQVTKVIPEFLAKHGKNFVKRIFYSYFLRDLSIASLELLGGLALLLFATVFGGFHWWQSLSSGQAAPVGTIVLTALAVLSGLQLLLAFLSFDMRPRSGAALHTVMPLGLKAEAKRSLCPPPVEKRAAPEVSQGL